MQSSLWWSQQSEDNRYWLC